MVARRPRLIPLDPGTGPPILSSPAYCASLTLRVLLHQVLLETFLISHTKNDALWQLLRTQFANCIERKPTVKHWSNLAYGTAELPFCCPLFVHSIVALTLTA